MSTTIPQNTELLKKLAELLAAHRKVFSQERVFQNAALLLIAEIVAFARHTVTQLLMSIGRTEDDWSKFYRLFSCQRLPYDALCLEFFKQTLEHVAVDQPYVVAGDGMQTPRSSRKMEGASFLHNPTTPPFMRGIHVAQRWSHCSWLPPSADGYTRAIPIRFVPAFTEKSAPTHVAPSKEWQAALDNLQWTRQQLDAQGRAEQKLLMVLDGAYDVVDFWRALPPRAIVLVRSAKNRALFELPPADSHRNRKYGERAPSPAELWRSRSGWKKVEIDVRGRRRHLRVKVKGPILRRGCPNQPLFLIIVGGKDQRQRGVSREPLPFLVNAQQTADGQWELPLALEDLLFWAWQRWEIEVTHRELKSGFGLGDKQCWSPAGAVLSVQWSAWVYAMLVLAGYRCWGLTNAPPVATRWWRGGRRWSLNTLWRAYRAALWGEHKFSPVDTQSLLTEGEMRWIQPAMRHAAFAAART